MMKFVVICVVVSVAHGGLVGVVPGLVANTAAIVAHDSPIVAPTILAGGLVATRGLISSPLTASGYPLLAPGSGIEGQYIHDLRGEGAEGQYVHDYTETLSDNGQYHGEIYA